MLNLYDLYYANISWNPDTPLTLVGCISAVEIPAHEAAETYGDLEVVCFNNNIVNLM